MLKRSAKIFLVLALSLVLVTTAFAQTDTDVKFTGVVTAVDPDAGTLTVEAEDGTVYTVSAPDDFDFDGVAVGDTVEVEGTGDGGNVTADEVKLEGTGGNGNGKGKGNSDTSDGEDTGDGGDEDGTDEDSAGEGDGGKLESHFCGEDGDQHPVMSGIAETYGVDYSEIQSNFCGENHFGLGQLMMAYQTAELTGESAADLLALRAEGQGWGKILKDLGVIGKPEDVGPPEGKGRNKDCEEAGDGEDTGGEDTGGEDTGGEDAGGDGESKGKGGSNKPSDDCKPGGKPDKDKDKGKPEDKNNGGGNGKGKGGD